MVLNVKAQLKMATLIYILGGHLNLNPIKKTKTKLQVYLIVRFFLQQCRMLAAHF